MKHEWYSEVVTEKGRAKMVLDFNKVVKSDYNIFVFVTARGQHGKTVSAFNFIKEMWDKHKQKSIYLFSTQSQIDTTWREYLDINRKVSPELWDGVSLKRTGFYDEEGTRFCKFVSLSTAWKEKSGSRGAHYIFYDECNLGLDRIGYRQFKMVEQLLFSTQLEGEDLTFFMFSNIETVAVPIFESLGIDNLEPTFQEKVFKSLRIAVYVPKLKGKEKKVMLAQKNWIQNVAELGGTAEQSVTAEQTYDNVENVIAKALWNEYRINGGTMYLQLDELGFLRLWEPKQGYFFLDRVKTKDGASQIVTWLGRFREVNVVFSYDLKERFILSNEAGRVFFQNYQVKSIFQESLKRMM